MGFRLMSLAVCSPLSRIMRIPLGKGVASVRVPAATVAVSQSTAGTTSAPPAAPLKIRSLLPPTGDAQAHRISKTDDCFPRKRSVVFLGNRAQYPSKTKYDYLKQGVSGFVFELLHVPLF